MRMGLLRGLRGLRGLRSLRIFLLIFRAWSARVHSSIYIYIYIYIWGGVGTRSTERGAGSTEHGAQSTVNWHKILCDQYLINFNELNYNLIKFNII